MTTPLAPSLPVAAVVVALRRPQFATEVVRNLVELERLPPERIVLVANAECGLDDPALQGAVRVVALAANIGPTDGFREGMIVASSLPEVEWLYLCQDEVFLFVLPSPRIEGLVRTAERLNAAGVEPVGAVVAWGGDLHRRTGHTTIHEVDCPVGFDDVDVASWSASLVSRSVLESGALPDDDYFFGCENLTSGSRSKRRASGSCSIERARSGWRRRRHVAAAIGRSKDRARRTPTSRGEPFTCPGTTSASPAATGRRPGSSPTLLTRFGAFSSLRPRPNAQPSSTVPWRECEE
jgi:hypothetical protein